MPDVKTRPDVKTMPDKPLTQTVLDRIDPIKIILVAALLVVAVFVWGETRDRVIEPLDNIVTERLCITYGEEIERSVVGYERSNRFGLVNRSEGFCRYGEGVNGEAPITLTIEETAPGRLYRGAKLIGIITQLGIVSIFLRFTIEPVLGFYRYIRSRQE